MKKKINLLLADDDEDDRFFFADALKQITIPTTLVTVNDGEKLIDYLLQSKNDKIAASKIKYCHLTYTDNGIGFDPQYNERIFEVFQRLHSQEEYSGTGIGLAICKRIIENHNGTITATGEPGKGARFDIFIPSITKRKD